MAEPLTNHDRSKSRFNFLPAVKVVAGLIWIWAAFGCWGQEGEVRRGSHHDAVLRVAVTTSTRDSGLLDYLMPEFEKQHSVRVDVLAVGSGAALKLGESGEVDAVWVHSPEDEIEFMRLEHGIRREPVMFNYFLLLGPKSDPAGIQKSSVAEAFRKIKSGGHPFVSRGDQSGTHKKELKVWESLHIEPDWRDRLESGQGMGASLTMANQVRAYILCDRGTYFRFRDRISLVPLVSDDPQLLNKYSVMVVNPNKKKDLNITGANQFADFLTAPSAQQKIADYQIEGQRLFFPNAIETSKLEASYPFRNTNMAGRPQ